MTGGTGRLSRMPGTLICRGTHFFLRVIDVGISAPKLDLHSFRMSLHCFDSSEIGLCPSATLNDAECVKARFIRHKHLHARGASHVICGLEVFKGGIPHFHSIGQENRKWLGKQILKFLRNGKRSTEWSFFYPEWGYACCGELIREGDKIEEFFVFELDKPYAGCRSLL